MGDADDYLARLDKIKQDNQAARRETDKEKEYKGREQERIRRFREARPIYSEKQKQKEFKPYGEAHYFLGNSPRSALSYQTAKNLFGKNYADRHFVNVDLPWSTWKQGDEEGGKKITKDEIGKFRGEIQATAYALMNSTNPGYFIEGAKLYAKLGKGRKAIPKLVKRAEEAREKGLILGDSEIRYMKLFVKKHGREQQQSEGGLERRLPVFILSSVVGIVLSISSLTATGNVISNLTGTSKGLIGLILFVVGLAGLVFGRRG